MKKNLPSKFRGAWGLATNTASSTARRTFRGAGKLATFAALTAAFATNTASQAWAGVPGILAQGAPTQVKEGFQYGLGLLFMIGFIWGVINIWGGADRLKKGDADGKMGIVSGIIIAGAAAIMAALFYIFGMSDGALTPQF